MARKKRAKASTESVEAAKVEVAEVEEVAEVIADTEESLLREGYSFLKEKGDNLVFIKAGVRKSIPKP